MRQEDPVEIDREVLADSADKDAPIAKTAPAVRADRALVPTKDRAVRQVDPFRTYMSEIRHFPALSRDEEVELARRYRDTGDREALFRLVTANLMLVVRVALSFRRAAKNLLDLVQEGNIGLLQAVDRYDPELGVRLPTYAGWWVRAYMIKFLLDNVRLVRVGTTNARRKLLRNLRQERQRLEQMGFEVGPKLLAERFGVSEEDVKDVQAALASHDVSLSDPIGEDEDRTRGDLLSSSAPSVEEEVARRDLSQKAQTAIARFREGLNEKERAILDDRILSEDPRTLQALGERFGTTREAVRQVEARLTARLKEYLRQALGDVGPVHFGP